MGDFVGGCDFGPVAICYSDGSVRSCVYCGWGGVRGLLVLCGCRTHSTEDRCGFEPCGSILEGNLMSIDERFPKVIFLVVVLTILMMILAANLYRPLWLLRGPHRCEVIQVAPEVPEWMIVEQGGSRKLLDPNGTVVGEVEVQK